MNILPPPGKKALTERLRLRLRLRFRLGPAAVLFFFGLFLSPFRVLAVLHFA